MTLVKDNVKTAKPKKQDILFLIITGLSGAGKTSVMRALEDLGFFCIDNLPLPLLASFLDIAFKADTNLSRVALGIDARGEQFLTDFTHTIKQLRHHEAKNLKVIFFNASEKTLLKRFQETRRKHPLAHGIDLITAIKKEKSLLEPIKALSDMILDTDIFNIYELRDWVRQSFSDGQKKELFVDLVSFGFKYGIPSESNLVYDIRFLPNPHFIPELKPLNGKHESIQQYLFTNVVVKDYWKHLTTFLAYSLQKFHEEGRSMVTIAIGCTGGKHRSVAFVEKLKQEKFDNIQFIVHHRDLGKE